MKKIEQAGYPYVPDSHGIFLERDGSGVSMIKTGSGEVVSYTVEQDYIEVKRGSLEPQMIAALLPGSQIAFSLKTVKDGIRHPDMFANRFVRFALRNFELLGMDIQSMVGYWSPGSVNYNQFISTYEATHDLEIAARSTWTGKTAEKNGFGIIDKDSVVWRPGREVIVLFDRNQA